MNATISNPEWFRTTRRNSLVFSALYAVSALILVKRFDTIGLIAASGLSFTLRAGQGFYYLLTYLDSLSHEIDTNIASVRPHKKVVTAFIFASLISALTWHSKKLTVKLSAGLISALVVVAFSYRYERSFLRTIYQTYMQKSKSKL